MIKEKIKKLKSQKFHLYKKKIFFQFLNQCKKEMSLNMKMRTLEKQSNNKILYFCYRILEAKSIKNPFSLQNKLKSFQSMKIKKQVNQFYNSLHLFQEKVFIIRKSLSFGFDFLQLFFNKSKVQSAFNRIQMEVDYIDKIFLFSDFLKLKLIEGKKRYSFYRIKNNQIEKQTTIYKLYQSKQYEEFKRSYQQLFASKNELADNESKEQHLRFSSIEESETIYHSGDQNEIDYESGKTFSIQNTKQPEIIHQKLEEPVQRKSIKKQESLNSMISSSAQSVRSLDPLKLTHDQIDLISSTIRNEKLFHFIENQRKNLKTKM